MAIGAEAWLSKNSCRLGAPTSSKQFDPAVGFVAERNPDHFKGWGPKCLDEIEFRAVKDTNTRVLGLLTRRFQGHRRLPPDRPAEEHRGLHGNAQVLEAELMRVMMAEFNMTRAPMNDPHVRRALNQAFDYDGFNKDILGGLVERNPDPAAEHDLGRPKDVKGYSSISTEPRPSSPQASDQARPADSRSTFLTGFAQSGAGRPTVPERPLQDLACNPR